ncbi:MAG: hypothetical protein ACOYNF_04330 [Rhodoferax sp.]|jgi:hypothetical protein|nr:hypothetical protein [Rhodoferax sp.]
MKRMKGDRYLVTPLDLSTLGEHLGCCQHTHRHWFLLHDMADAMHGFVSARFATTLGIIGLAVGVACWLI